MKNFKTIEEKVKYALSCNEKARDDDMTLYLCVCAICLPSVVNMSFANVMLRYRSLDLPNYESVGRIRRRLQAKHPELAASPDTKKRRAAQERLYRHYSKE
ncbi:hypothetical protein LJC51_03125 [Lachnospiraceae bacterium OttesenSCG-928-J05]|nr:hypothetical protein [Lachnospiraceae bacterium OttesenSCG-928-J05]MDL2276316.1 hypothetical protein [Breznakia sp. OttesenSCG-928-G09]